MYYNSLILNVLIGKCGALEAVTEEKCVVFDGIAPVCPVVSAGTGVELVRNALFHQLFVKIAVDFKEEVLCAAIKDDVQ